MTATREQITRLYDTVFDRAPDLGGLEFWQAAADRGVSLPDMASFFMTAPEFAATYGQPDNLSFVRSMYANVLDREGEAEGVSFWTRALDQGHAARNDIVVCFSESREHQEQMARAAAEPPVMVTIAPPVDAPPVMPTKVQQGVVELPTSGFDVGRATPPTTAVSGTDGDDTLDGTDRSESLNGFGGDDTLRAWGGGDYLVGGRGGDALYGGAGDDTLVGGGGGDWLYGGEGGDTFRFETLAEIDANPLRDFEPGLDRLDFRPFSLLFRGAGAFQGFGGAELRYEEDASETTAMQWKTGPSTQVLLDADGDGAADRWVLVVGRVLSDADFLV